MNRPDPQLQNTEVLRQLAHAPARFQEMGAPWFRDRHLHFLLGKIFWLCSVDNWCFVKSHKIEDSESSQNKIIAGLHAAMYVLPYEKHWIASSWWLSSGYIVFVDVFFPSGNGKLTKQLKKLPSVQSSGVFFRPVSAWDRWRYSLELLQHCLLQVGSGTYRMPIFKRQKRKKPPTHGSLIYGCTIIVCSIPGCFL